MASIKIQHQIGSRVYVVHQDGVVEYGEIMEKGRNYSAPFPYTGAFCQVVKFDSGMMKVIPTIGIYSAEECE